MQFNIRVVHPEDDCGVPVTFRSSVVISGSMCIRNTLNEKENVCKFQQCFLKRVQNKRCDKQNHQGTILFCSCQLIVSVFILFYEENYKTTTTNKHVNKKQASNKNTTFLSGSLFARLWFIIIV